MTKSETDRTGCTFSVSEHDGIDPWIMIETRSPGLKILGNGFIGLEMREDISFEDAAKLAELLREKVARISYTSFK
jgi:hypothetical protein